MDKCKKVYIVHTALLGRRNEQLVYEDEMSNYAAYKIIADDAEEAIRDAKNRFELDNEYVESVELAIALNS